MATTERIPSRRKEKGSRCDTNSSVWTVEQFYEIQGSIVIKGTIRVW
jgi:hypothetical protein